MLSGITWDEALRDFLSGRKARRCRPKTLQTYRTQIKQFTHWAEDQEPPLSLSGAPDGTAPVTARHVRRYLELRADSVSPHTHYTDFVHLKMFFKFCRAERYVRANPMADFTMKRPEYRRPDCPTEEEARRIVQAVRKYRRETGKYMDEDRKTFLIKRDECIIQALYLTGPRVSELLAIKSEDVVRGAEPKLKLRHTKTGRERIVFVNEDWLELLDAYLRVRPAAYKDGEPLPTDNLFITENGEALSHKWYVKQFKKYATAAGMPDVTTKKLRRLRTTAIAMINPAIASELGGHSIEVIKKHYWVPPEAPMREAWAQTVAHSELVNKRSRRAV